MALHWMESKSSVRESINVRKNDVLDRMLVVCGSWRQGEIFHLKRSEKGKEHCF